MLEIDKIRALIEMMVKNDLVEISLRDGEEEISLRRPHAASGGLAPDFMIRPAAAVPTLAPVSSTSPASLPTNPPPRVDDADLLPIASPMVGTFYSASDPDSPPFIQVGQAVSVGSLVCILEAMKVFNEIKSEVAGTIEKVLAKNAQAVEYGQVLFLVRPH